MGRRPMSREMPQSGKDLIWIVRYRRCVSWFEVCKTSKLPKGNGFTFFSLLRKERGVAERPRPSRLPENGSKLYRIIFFVLLPFSIPKPAYGATHLFGCFEPVRKGCCTSDARPVLFGNGLPHCKLTEASYIQKGKLHVIFIAVKI